MCQRTVRKTWGAVLSFPAQPRSVSLASVWGASMRVPSTAKAVQRPRCQYGPGDPEHLPLEPSFHGLSQRRGPAPHRGGEARVGRAEPPMRMQLAGGLAGVLAADREG